MKSVAALTELELRQMIRERGPFDSVTVAPGTLITPAARQFLQERRIKLLFGEEARTGPSKAAPVPEAPPAAVEPAPTPTPKPEQMTHLHGKTLVAKTHPRIRFRGKLDSLEAHILLAQMSARRAGLAELDGSLGEVLNLVRRIVRAEVLNEPLPPISLFGLDDAQLREHSHNPLRYYGVSHTMPSADHGEVMLWLNLVRTQVREAEVLGARAFWREGEQPERLDIIQALNRLSSAIWILMMRHLADKGGTGDGVR